MHFCKITISIEILGRGMGGFIGGQLNSVGGLSLPQVFYAISLSVALCVILARLAFAAWGGKYVDRMVSRRQKILKSIEANRTMAQKADECQRFNSLKCPL